VAERQRARVEGYIQVGVAEGAKVVTGGKRPEAVNKGETPMAQIAESARGSSSGRLIQKTSGIRGAWGGVRNRPGMEA